MELNACLYLVILIISLKLQQHVAPIAYNVSIKQIVSLAMKAIPSTVLLSVFAYLTLQTASPVTYQTSALHATPDSKSSMASASVCLTTPTALSALCLPSALNALPAML